MDELSTPQSDIVTRAPVEVTLESGKVYWWCVCGRSKDQPFCDGSHKGTGLTPMRYQAIESGNKLFCVCKQTAAAPFCDGAPRECGKSG